jgi:hypothetical protein
MGLKAVTEFLSAKKTIFLLTFNVCACVDSLVFASALYDNIITH